MYAVLDQVSLALSHIMDYEKLLMLNVRQGQHRITV